MAKPGDVDGEILIILMHRSPLLIGLLKKNNAYDYFPRAP